MQPYNAALKQQQLKAANVQFIKLKLDIMQYAKV